MPLSFPLWQTTFLPTKPLNLNLPELAGKGIIFVLTGFNNLYKYMGMEGPQRINDPKKAEAMARASNRDRSKAVEYRKASEENAKKLFTTQDIVDSYAGRGSRINNDVMAHMA